MGTNKFNFFDNTLNFQERVELIAVGMCEPRRKKKPKGKSPPKTKADFNRMLALLQLLASGCPAPFRTPLVPINLVAVCTRVVQFFADVQERVVVSLL